MEITLHIDKARIHLNSPEFDGYGDERMYGVVEDGESAGQIVAIKSEYHLDKYQYSRVYLVLRGSVPVRKA